MQTTEEGNAIIAVFDGKVKDTDSPWWGGFDFMIHGGVRQHGSSLKYHSSWDWQIPVWRKVNLAIKDTISKKIDSQPGLYHIKLKAYLGQICHRYNNAVFKNDPQLGQQILVEAIIWCNSNTSPVNKEQ